MHKLPTWFWGEFLGTFLLVFFGCSTVAVAITLGVFEGVFQIAAVWGLGLTLAIYLTAGRSGAHLNPAVTIALALIRDFPKNRILGYFVAQFLGAIVAALLIVFLYSGVITAFEQTAGITRGGEGSMASALILGGYFDSSQFSHIQAFGAEFVGTALLAFVIFSLTNKKNEACPAYLVPAVIGGVLIVLIPLFGSITNGCFNPARDIGPKLVASMAGWGSAPFSINGIAWLTVYTVAPCLGACLGGWIADNTFGKQE